MVKTNRKTRGARAIGDGSARGPLGLLARSAALLAGVMALVLVPAATAGAAPAPHQVQLCHATGSQSNPYVFIDVDYHSVIKSGHGGHTGPIWQPGITVRWGDIILPFDFGGDATYPGMNWSAAGQAIVHNGCATSAGSTSTTAAPTPATTVPATTVPTPTTTVPDTTTTAPGSTSTVPAATSTVPETTSTVPTSESTVPTSVLGERATATDPTSPPTAAAAAASPVTTTTSPAQVLGVSETRPVTGNLPITGVAVDLAVGVAAALLVGGIALVLRARAGVASTDR